MAFFRDRAWPFFLSLLVHAAIVGLLIYGVVKFGEDPKPQPPPQLAIEAPVVDEKQVQQEMRQLQEEEERKQRELREQEERAEQPKREREAEEQRLEEVREQRAAEKKRSASGAEREGGRKLRGSRSRTPSARRPRGRRRGSARTMPAAREAARRRSSASEREAELRRRLEAEEQRAAAVDAGLLAQYLAQIQARIQRAWIRPPQCARGPRTASCMSRRFRAARSYRCASGNATAMTSCASRSRRRCIAHRRCRCRPTRRCSNGTYA